MAAGRRNEPETESYRTYDMPRLISKTFQTWAMMPLRLIVGYGFISHGYSKLSHGPEHFATILRALGVPFSEFSAWATIAVELLGGLLFLAGAFVAVASIPMRAVMLTAIFTVHLHYGFNSVKLLAITSTGAQFGPVGYEVNLLYIACMAAVVFGGAGPFSVDGLLTSSKESPKGA
jgi:putative oxidoreductase